MWLSRELINFFRLSMVFINHGWMAWSYWKMLSKISIRSLLLLRSMNWAWTLFISLFSENHAAFGSLTLFQSVWIRDDPILYGAFREGFITELVGQSCSGKTQVNTGGFCFCLSICLLYTYAIAQRFGWEYNCCIHMCGCPVLFKIGFKCFRFVS